MPSGEKVTQATVSRDLEQIGAVKVKRGGALGYALPDQLGGSDWAAGRLQRIFAEWVQSLEIAGSLIVLRTPPGSAHVVGSALDRTGLPDVLGTVAGDDTVLLVVAETSTGQSVAHRISDLAGL